MRSLLWYVPSGCACVPARGCVSDLHPRGVPVRYQPLCGLIVQFPLEISQIWVWLVLPSPVWLADHSFVWWDNEFWWKMCLRVIAGEGAVLINYHLEMEWLLLINKVINTQTHMCQKKAAKQKNSPQNPGRGLEMFPFPYASHLTCLEQQPCAASLSWVTQSEMRPSMC